eukprot:TCONS_00014381-protein
MSCQLIMNLLILLSVLIFEKATATNETEITCQTSCIHEYGETCLNDQSRCQCRDGFFKGRKVCEDLNECASPSTNDCHGNAKCINLFGTYQCTCKNGFQGNGTHCEDINECISATNETRCHEHAQCVNTNGSYTCQCLDGYHGNGTYCELLVCKEDTCNPFHGEKCIIEDNHLKCTCAKGYFKGRKVCEDFNECASPLNNDCHDNAKCINLFGSYRCTCENGFQGNGTHCEDINECRNAELQDCHTNAKCNNTIGAYQCTCLDGYHGNGTYCINTNTCEYQRSKCSTNATCVDLSDSSSYECHCNQGFTGDGSHCKDENECESKDNLCHLNATCYNTIGSYHCVCNNGFQGDGISCQDKNECLTPFLNECPQDSSCGNTIGSFQCPCNAGFEQNNGLCIDLNECQTQKHKCDQNALCQNTHGSYRCQCFDGFYGDGKTCHDVDECHQNISDCHSQAHCTNTIGSYTCACAENFIGNGTFCRAKTCLDRSCPKYSYCSDLTGCHCNLGFLLNKTTSLCDQVKTGSGILVQNLHLKEDFKEEYLDKSSQEYIQFIARLESTLLKFMTVVYPWVAPLSVNVKDLRRGSVVVDYVVTYATDDELSLDVMKREIEYGLLRNQLEVFETTRKTVQVSSTNGCNLGFPKCNSITESCQPLAGFDYDCVCKMNFTRSSHNGKCSKITGSPIFSDHQISNGNFTVIGAACACIFVVLLSFLTAFLLAQRKHRAAKKQANPPAPGPSIDANWRLSQDGRQATRESHLNSAYQY